MSEKIIDINHQIKDINSVNLENMVESCEIGPTTGRQRRQDAFQVRLDAAIFQRDLPLPGHPCNGDEDLYPNKIGNFSKALPHNQLGEVDLNAYKAYLRALSTGNPDDFEMIPLRGGAKLANPQSAYAYELAGPDSHHLSIPPAPAFSSAWNASEMAELYWLALTRDVPFAEYDTNPLTLAAASESFQILRLPRTQSKRGSHYGNPFSRQHSGRFGGAIYFPVSLEKHSFRGLHNCPAQSHHSGRRRLPDFIPGLAEHPKRIFSVNLESVRPRTPLYPQ